MCFRPMPPDASDFPGGIPALQPVEIRIVPVTHSRPDKHQSST